MGLFIVYYIVYFTSNYDALETISDVQSLVRRASKTLWEVLNLIRDTYFVDIGV